MAVSERCGYGTASWSEEGPVTVLHCVTDVQVGTHCAARPTNCTPATCKLRFLTRAPGCSWSQDDMCSASPSQWNHALYKTLPDTSTRFLVLRSMATSTRMSTHWSNMAQCYACLRMPQPPHTRIPTGHHSPGPLLPIATSTSPNQGTWLKMCTLSPIGTPKKGQASMSATHLTTVAAQATCKHQPLVAPGVA